MIGRSMLLTRLGPDNSVYTVEGYVHVLIAQHGDCVDKHPRRKRWYRVAASLR